MTKSKGDVKTCDSIILTNILSEMYDEFSRDEFKAKIRHVFGKPTKYEAMAYGFLSYHVHVTKWLGLRGAKEYVKNVNI